LLLTAVLDSALVAPAAAAGAPTATVKQHSKHAVATPVSLETTSTPRSSAARLR
jgi:hypothetical protein